MDEILEQFETLIDPVSIIPEASIEIHNITQQMVQGKPKIEEVLPTIIKMIGSHIIIGHGVKFDVDMIANAADRAGVPMTLRNNPLIDTLRLARLYGESPTNSLEQLRKHFNIEAEGAHRAMSDVLVNIDVFKFLSKKFKTTSQIFDVLSRPILLKNMPLGKHKGRPMKEIPLDYLIWASHTDFDQDLIFSLQTEIKKRKKGKSFGQGCNPFGAL
jgi:DNA polymerase-3 subunit epsilon